MTAGRMSPRVLAYYNDSDSFAASCLRNLIAAELIPNGHVDERNIEDVRATDLVGYSQCHFFAGIGGWPCALRHAGWPDDRPVWTGSCPCQPVSIAGRRKGAADERHLWPEFHRLIAERRPATVFGEQVASDLGREWLSRVRLDLEASGYAVGAANIGAAGVGAPHIRQRLYWVAHSDLEHVPAKHRCQLNGSTPERNARDHERAGRGAPDHWSNFATLEGRPFEPGAHLLVDGFPDRLAQLYALGNAIVPKVGAQFIAASCEALAMDLGAIPRRERYQDLDAFDRVNQRPAHRPTKSENVHTSGRPSGNSVAALLRRLRNGRPDIHARVLAGVPIPTKPPGCNGIMPPGIPE